MLYHSHGKSWYCSNETCPLEGLERVTSKPTQKTKSGLANDSDGKTLGGGWKAPTNKPNRVNVDFRVLKRVLTEPKGSAIIN
jgi:hypothetical protein